ncbi:hypothetical protein Tco_1285940 [Tanacetum coccineum]
MAALKYRDEHNRIGFLEKPKGSTDYHQVIDFLLDSHIRYAIVTDPLIYDSLITQFWSTASLRSSELGPPAIVATIDGTPYTITESLVRSQLQLHDEGGIVDMPIPDIFLGMDNLVLSQGVGDQFGTPLAIALICLCEGKKYNWSRYIFTGMLDCFFGLLTLLRFLASDDPIKRLGFPPSSSIHTDAFVHGNDVPSGTASDFSAAPSNKGKSPMVEEDPPIKERSFRQMEEDRLGAEAARKLHEEEQAELARVQEEMKKKRQAEDLTGILFGPDVNEENFAERMVAIIAERRRQFEAQWLQEKRDKPMTFAQQKHFMRTFVKNLSSVLLFNRWSLKFVKTFTDDQIKAESKKSKSSAATQTHVPSTTHQSSVGVPTNVHQSPFVDTPPGTPPYSPKASSQPDVTPDTSVDPTVAPTPPFATPVSRSSGPRTRSQSFDADIKTYSTRRKSLAPRKMPSSEGDLYAPDTSFIKVLSDDVSDVLFFMSLFESTTGGSSVEVWDDQQEWVIHSWKLFPFSSVHVLETFSGKILYMFADTPYPLSASLMKKMLKHKLEVEIDGIGNDMDIGWATDS